MKKLNNLGFVKRARHFFYCFFRYGILTDYAKEILFVAFLTVLFGLLMYFAYTFIYLDICEKIAR